MRKSYSLKLAAFTAFAIVIIALVCSYNLTTIKASPKKGLIVTHVALQLNQHKINKKNKDLVEFVIKTNGDYTPIKLVAKGTSFSPMPDYIEKNTFYGEKIVNKGRFKANKTINVTITLKRDDTGKRTIVRTTAPVFPPHPESSR